MTKDSQANSSGP